MPHRDYNTSVEKGEGCKVPQEVNALSFYMAFQRYHRTYGQECLQLHRPSTLQEVREVTEAFLKHSNEERPHQGRTCGNVPPRVAFPTLPPLPALAIRGLTQMPG